MKTKNGLRRLTLRFTRKQRLRWGVTACLLLIASWTDAQTTGARHQQSGTNLTADSCRQATQNIPDAETLALQILQGNPETKVRFVTRATLYGIGQANLFDTYLSPLEYTGPEVRVSRENMRPTTLMQGKVSRQTLFHASMSYTHNRADNNNTVAGFANWSYALHHRFGLTPAFRLLAGAFTEVNVGALYNLRNSNNPVSVRTYLNIGASVIAAWDLRIGKRPLTLRYQANLPLAGVFFSPHYGQSYYEIFSLNNDGGTVRFTSLHNQPSLRQTLSADVPVGKAKMRITYMWDAQQANINHIKSHAYSHAFMVGFVKDLYRIRTPKSRF